MKTPSTPQYRSCNGIGHLSHGLQWCIAVGLALAVTAIVSGAVVTMMLLLILTHGLHTAWALLATGGTFAVFLPVSLPLIQASFTPLLSLLGWWRYVSPLMFVEGTSATVVEIHGGTWWDYACHFRTSDAGAHVRTGVLVAYIEALLTLADLLEAGRISPDAEIRGTSYFFDERTATKLGFQIHDPSTPRLAMLWVGLIEISTKLSFARGRLSLAPVWKAKLATIGGAELVGQKPALSALHRRLLALQTRADRRRRRRRSPTTERGR